MPVHIFLVSEDNYKICIHKGLAAIPLANKPDINDQLISRFSLFRDNDKVLFYLTGSKEIRGVYKVIGRPFYDETPVWNSENGQVYPYRVRIDNTETVFETPILLSDVYDLRDSSKIWTFSLNRPGGTVNSIFSISDVEYDVILELFHKINHVVNKPSPILEPYRHFQPNLISRLNFDKGSPKYESTVMSLFFNSLALMQFQEILGNYTDYLAYVPTSFQKEIDAVLFYSAGEDRKKIIAYSIIELKRGTFDENGLAQLLRYENWFLKKRVNGDFRAIRTVAIASDFNETAIDYLRRRRKMEEKTVRLIRYSFENERLILNEVSY